MNIQDPAIREKVRNAMGEMSASMTRIEAERDLLKEIVKKLNEDHELSKKALNKIAKVYHRQSYSKELEEMDDFSTMYETILGGS
jgi:DNA repair ATPase RecN